MLLGGVAAGVVAAVAGALKEGPMELAEGLPKRVEAGAAPACVKGVGVGPVAAEVGALKPPKAGVDAGAAGLVLVGAGAAATGVALEEGLNLKEDLGASVVDAVGVAGAATAPNSGSFVAGCA